MPEKTGEAKFIFLKCEEILSIFDNRALFENGCSGCVSRQMVRVKFYAGGGVGIERNVCYQMSNHYEKCIKSLTEDQKNALIELLRKKELLLKEEGEKIKEEIINIEKVLVLFDHKVV